MLAHGWNFSFVFLKIKIKVSFFVSRRQNWMSFRPFHPSYFVFLVLKLEFLDEIGRKWSPQEKRSRIFNQNGQNLILIIPFKPSHFATIWHLFLRNHLSTLVDHVDIVFLVSDCQVGRIVAPSDSRRTVSVCFLIELEDLSTRAHEFNLKIQSNSACITTYMQPKNIQKDCIFSIHLYLRHLCMHLCRWYEINMFDDHPILYSRIAICPS